MKKSILSVIALVVTASFVFSPLVKADQSTSPVDSGTVSQPASTPDTSAPVTSPPADTSISAPTNTSAAPDSTTTAPTNSTDLTLPPSNDSLTTPTTPSTDTTTTPSTDTTTTPNAKAPVKPGLQPNTLSGQSSASQAYIDKSLQVKLPNVDNASGAFTYDYPIVVPPGRNGLQPDLKLTYNNQQANNQNGFGFGWSVSIPYIQRFDKKGITTQYTDNYFSSSMSGELVSTGTGTYAARTENGDFLKYTYDSTNNRWTVLDKKGTTYKFGYSSSTRQDDPNDSTRVYKWMLEEIRDTNNNYISFSYYKDSGEIYPSVLKYTGNGSTDGPFEVDFLRTTRGDHVQAYSAGFSVTDNYVINEIDLKFNSVWTSKYVLGYSNGDNGVRSLLTSITKSGQDVNNNVTTLPATTFSYQVATDSSTKWTLNTGLSLPSGVVNLYDCVVTDVNGDGLPDILQAYASSTGQQFFNAWLNDGNGGWVSSTNYTPPILFFNDANVPAGDMGVRVVDVNGDGLPDIIQHYGSTVTTYLNNGNGWTQTTTTFQSPVIFADSSNTDTRARIADVNGDGLPDIITTNQYDNGTGVYLNTGTGWTLDSTWTVPVTDNQYVYYVDVNGDGLADVLESYETYNPYVQTLHAYINNGHGWTLNSNWTPPISFFGNSSGSLYSLGVRMLDVNGDGLPDIVQSYPQASTTTYLNTGNGWVNTTVWNAPVPFDENVNHSNTNVTIADFNGDNMIDFAQRAPGTSIYIAQKRKADLLTQITYNTGGNTQVTYKTSGQYRDSSNNIANPHLPLLIDTANSVVTNDGAGLASTKTYYFSDGKYYYNSTSDRKFSAFGLVTQTDDAGNLTKNYFHGGYTNNSSLGEYNDNYFKIGKQYRQEVYNNSSALYSKDISKWDSYDPGTGNGFVKLLQTVNNTYDGGSSHKDKATAYTYDNSTGNLTQQIEYGQVTGNDDGTFTDTGTDDFTSTYSYAANTTAYIYLPDDVTVTDHNSNKAKEDRYYYDSQSLGTVTLGNQTKHEMFKTGTTYINTQKGYDGTYGVVTSDADPRGKTTSYSLDTYHMYPATVTDPLTHQASYTYDYSSGKVTQKTDPNTRVYQWTYDGLDRLTAVKQPDLTTPSTLVTKTAYVYTDTSGAVNVHETDNLDSSTAKERYAYYDGLGRLIQTRVEAEGTNYEASDKVYNNLGLLLKESLPYFSTGSSQTSATTTSSLYTSYTYDPMLRIVTTVNNLGTTTNTYNLWKLTVTDANSKAKDLYKDAYGNLIRVDEHNSGNTYSTYYSYDYLGDLLSVTDALSDIRNFTYDGLGRRLTAQDLHASGDTTYGSYSYTYDDAGNMTQKVDANNNTVNYTYDNINRVLTEDFTGSTGTEVTYAYDTGTDGIGHLITVTKSDGNNTAYTYNPDGGIKSETETIGGTNYETDYTYDYEGNQVTITSPDGSQVKYIYNSAGLLNEVQRKESGDSGFTDVVSNFDYSPTDQPITISYANGATTTNTYDTTKLYRLTSKVTTIAASAHAQDLSYTYDAVGNITQIVDASSTDTAKTANYTYDDLYRLTQAAITNVASGQTAYTENYSYNAIGDLTSKTGPGSYTYGGNTGTNYANPDAPTAIGSNTYTYDNNGNLLTSTTGGSGSGWYNTGGTWTTRKQLTIDHTKVSGTSSLSNFPVLVSVTDPDLKTVANGGHVGKSDGTDILFTASDGLTKVSHEIEKYDGTAGTLIAWVKVSSLSPTTDTVLIIYYGNASASDQQDKTNVWDSNTKGVWHLNNSLNDSTSNADNGTNHSSSNTTSGKIGDARNLTGSSDYVTVPSVAALKPTAAITVSFWMKRNGAQPSYAMPLWFGQDNNAPWGPYGFETDGSSDTIYDFKVSSNSTDYYATNTTSLANLTWYYITGTYDGSNLKIYVNGNVEDTTAASFTIGNYDSTNGLGIGDSYSPSSNFNGYIDEVHVSSVARSSDWIKTEYNNQNSPGTFMTLGTVSGGSGSTTTNTWDYNNRLTQTAASSTVTYGYDFAGNRVKYANGTTTTIYPTKFYNTNGTTVTKHILTPDGTLLATVQTASGTTTARYVHTDQLTGSNVVTNSSDTKDEILDYLPFGSMRFDEQPGSYSEQKKFAGSQYDSDTGLNYLGARYLDTSRGQFLSEDPVFLSLGTGSLDILGNPQALNSYSYADNNPLVKIDPTGRFSLNVLGFLPNSVQVNIGNWANNAYANNSIARFALDHPYVPAITGAAPLAAYAAVTAAPTITTLSASKAVVGAVGGLTAQYIGDISNNIVNGQTGVAVLAPRSSPSQYAISAISVGGTAVFLPQATPLAIGTVASGTAFVQDRAAGLPITVGGIANNLITGLGASATEGLIRQTPGVPGRLPGANTTADFIGAHAIANYTKQAVSSVSQFISSAVGSFVNKLFDKSN